MDFLRCPVCKERLNKVDHSYVCNNRHNYDISSYNYTNMLLANQHHSLNPGDSKEMILARKRFLTLDYYACLRKTILETILKYNHDASINFLDIACGEGYYTNYLHENLSKSKKVNTVGIDISKPAIIEACKRVKESRLDNIEYFISNLSNLCFLSETFDFMLNCFAPLDDKEFYRVLKKGGYFIRVLPDVYHLYGLKEALYDKVILNVPKDEKLEGFKMVENIHIEDEMTLKNKDEILDLFMMTPYYYKSSMDSIEKLSKYESLKTKIAFSLLVYRKDED